MKLDFVKFDPTGNTTILVTTPVPRERHGAVAAALLSRLGGEQVGYVEAPTLPGVVARLQMMGGEFCGNATMSLGALLARERRTSRLEVRLEVSGIEGPVPCRVEYNAAAGCWIGSVSMPRPERIGEQVLATDAGPLVVPLVQMPGISHLLIPASVAPDEAQLRRRLPEWNAALGADALGALTWDEERSTIDPLVYVPASGTLVRENGCGSGSAAVGCWLARRAGRDLRTDVRQPGGTITVDARMQGGVVASVTITGRVELVEEGSTDL